MNQDYDVQLTFEQIVQACNDDSEWLMNIMAEDIVSIVGRPQDAVFSGFQMARIRKAYRISRDFEASAPATALILDLLDELDVLRNQL